MYVFWISIFVNIENRSFIRLEFVCKIFIMEWKTESFGNYEYKTKVPIENYKKKLVKDSEWVKLFTSVKKNMDVGKHVCHYRSGSRNAAMTLSYGVFFECPDPKNFDRYEWDFTVVDPKITQLKCCWPNETKQYYFYGFHIIPYGWESNYGSLRICDMIMNETDSQVSYSFDAHASEESPNTFAPTDYDWYSTRILKQYIDHKTWSESLIASNFRFMQKHMDIAETVFHNDIIEFNESKKYDDVLKMMNNELSEYGNNLLKLGSQPGWCFIPSDCASCS
jgi:hypothetical protein